MHMYSKNQNHSYSKRDILNIYSLGICSTGKPSLKMNVVGKGNMVLKSIIYNEKTEPTNKVMVVLRDICNGDRFNKI